MSWTVTQSYPSHPKMFKYDRRMVGCFGTPDPFQGLSAFEPSTSIAHAWEVVDHLVSLGVRTELTVYCNRTAFAVLYAQGAPFCSSGGPTAALAICRAALKAVAS